MYVINPDGTVGKMPTKPYKLPIGNPNQPRAIPNAANTNIPKGLAKGGWTPQAGSLWPKLLPKLGSRMVPYLGQAMLAHDLYELGSDMAERWYQPQGETPNPGNPWRLPPGHNYYPWVGTGTFDFGKYISSYASWNVAELIEIEWILSHPPEPIMWPDGSYEHTFSFHTDSFAPDITFKSTTWSSKVWASPKSWPEPYRPPIQDPDYEPIGDPVPDWPLYPQPRPAPWEIPQEWQPYAPTPDPNNFPPSQPDPLPPHPDVIPPKWPIWPFPTPPPFPVPPPNPNPKPNPFPQPRPDENPDPSTPNPNPVPIPNPTPLPEPAPVRGRRRRGRRDRYPHGMIPVTEVEAGENLAPHPYPEWHKNEPPEKGTKERKRRVPQDKLYNFGQGLMKTFGKFTESDDFIRAVYKALPWQVRRWRGRDGIWRDRHWNSKDRLGAIWQYNHMINIAEAINNIMIDQANDSVVGKYGQMQAEQYGKVGMGLTGAHQGERQKQQLWDDVEKKWKRSQPMPVREFKRWVKSPNGKWRLITDHRPATTIPWLRTKNNKGYTRYRNYQE